MTSEASWIDAETADSGLLRDLFGRFLTGVTIVTVVDDDGRMRGFTANSFTSVSLDPPLVLVCIGNRASTFGPLTSAPRFGVNILAEGQRELSTRFATAVENRFEGVDLFGPEDAAPLIRDSLACLDCAREQVVEAGDHAIVVGRVRAFRTASGLPLGYYRGAYATFGFGAEALQPADEATVALGCLLDADGRVLLCRRPGCANWEIPTLPLGRGEDHRQLIPRLLRILSVSAAPTLLYSVYRDRGDRHMTMIFTGRLEHAQVPEALPDGTELRLFDEAERPWERLVGPSPSNVVRRFFEERRDARFGIYWETDGGGHLAPLDGTPRRWVRTQQGSGD